MLKKHKIICKKENCDCSIINVKEKKRLFKNVIRLYCDTYISIIENSKDNKIHIIILDIYFRIYKNPYKSYFLTNHLYKK